MNPQASYSPICGGSDWNSTPDVNLLYLYDGWNLIAEMDATSTPVVARSYAWGTDLSGTLQGAGGVGGLLMANLGDGNTTQMIYYGYDGNGNVNALVDTSGNLVGTYDYDAFGKVVQVSGGWAGYNNIRFSTKHAETNATYGGSGLGLIYYGYRFYNPEIGRFLNRDPVSELGGLNVYAMCGNNLTNNWDKLGLASKYSGFDSKQITALQIAEKTAALVATKAANLLFNLKVDGIMKKYPSIGEYINRNVGSRERLDDWIQTSAAVMLLASSGLNQNQYEIKCSCTNGSGPDAAHAETQRTAFGQLVLGGAITIYPSFFSETAESQANTILHESTHLFAYTADNLAGLTWALLPKVQDDAYWYGDFVPNPERQIDVTLRAVNKDLEIYLGDHPAMTLATNPRLPHFTFDF